MIESAYHQLLKEERLVKDPNQKNVVIALQNLYDELNANNPNDSTILEQITAIVARKPKDDCIKGLYIWGGVGRGKTLLMDLFFNNLPTHKKIRLHFHRFMHEAHRLLKLYRNESDPLKLVANEFAKKAKVLCFDEFLVNDIGDAMILSGLLQGLFQNNVVLVATSNVNANLLYKNGLQRERFLPAIKLLNENTKVIELCGEIDHRFEFLKSNDVYDSPISESSKNWLKQNFRNLADELTDESWEIIRINDRPIQTIRHTDSVGWFDFKEICDGPRGATDYIQLAKIFHTVLISHVPIFDNKDDQARRFINLVDEFYDRNVKLILSAEDKPHNLYKGKRLKDEFMRTASRLSEMQSHDYLAKQHQPE